VLDERLAIGRQRAMQGEQLGPRARGDKAVGAVDHHEPISSDAVQAQSARSSASPVIDFTG